MMYTSSSGKPLILRNRDMMDESFALKQCHSNNKPPAMTCCTIKSGDHDIVIMRNIRKILKTPEFMLGGRVV